MNPLSFNSIIRADCVKRWQVVAVAREQSVAEHSFNVITISREIFKEFVERAGIKMSASVTSYWIAGIMEAAYLHDLAEVETGDIHTNAKRLLGIGTLVSHVEHELLRGHDLAPVDNSEFPVDKVIKAADLMDAIRFLRMWGVGTRASDIQCEITNTLVTLIAEVPTLALRDALNTTLNKICEECRA